MRAFMTARLAVLLIAGGLATLAGCGKEIGDSCQLATDCDPDGSRYCLIDTENENGYCTIMGCDYNTCPDEAECVEFFMGQFANEPCNPATEDGSGSDATDDCNPDEVCDLQGFCAEIASEVRYCMRKCNNDGDCRSGYECRNYQLMQEHGGEVVLAPGEVDTTSTSGFCAQAPSS
jgi:hypothetical protein